MTDETRATLEGMAIGVVVVLVVIAVSFGIAAVIG